MLYVHVQSVKKELVTEFILLIKNHEKLAHSIMRKLKQLIYTSKSVAFSMSVTVRFVIYMVYTHLQKMGKRLESQGGPFHT